MVLAICSYKSKQKPVPVLFKKDVPYKTHQDIDEYGKDSIDITTIVVLKNIDNDEIIFNLFYYKFNDEKNVIKSLHEVRCHIDNGESIKCIEYKKMKLELDAFTTTYYRLKEIENYKCE